MRRSLFLLSFSGLLLATVCPVASAVIPDPTFSHCDQKISVGPTGACPFSVTVYDMFANLLANATVVVDFGTCPVVLSPSQDPEFTVSGATISGMTNAQGVVVFRIRGTGGGSCAVKVRAASASQPTIFVQFCSFSSVQVCQTTPAHQHSWGKLRTIYR